mgnify:CR=1 FL=1
MKKQILIVGGGTAGWLTAGYLAKRLGADLPGGVDIRLVESSSIGILGVGEGTFPTIRKTLATIGVDEAELVRRCGATFKQGARFANWRTGDDHYLHAFQQADERSGPELLPYWRPGGAGDEGWDAVSTPQKKAADAHRAPKLPSHPDYVAPLNYAFHFDAVILAELLRDQAVANGVAHLTDTVTEVIVGADGAVAGVRAGANGLLEADLYIRCTRFRAGLVGQDGHLVLEERRPRRLPHQPLVALVGGVHEDRHARREQLGARRGDLPRDGGWPARAAAAVRDPRRRWFRRARPARARGHGRRQ